MTEPRIDGKTLDETLEEYAQDRLWVEENTLNPFKRREHRGAFRAFRIARLLVQQFEKERHR